MQIFVNTPSVVPGNWLEETSSQTESKKQTCLDTPCAVVAQDDPNAECQDFLLSVCMLDGTKVSVPVNMDTTIWEICDALHEKLNAPLLHEFHIYTGDQELCVGLSKESVTSNFTVAAAGLSKESIIQALLVASVTEAIRFMQNVAGQYKSKWKLSESELDSSYLWACGYRNWAAEDKDLFSQAVAVLGKSTGLTGKQEDDLHLVIVPVILSFGQMRFQLDQMPEGLVDSMIKSFLHFSMKIPAKLSLFNEATKQLCGLAARFGGKSAIPLLHQLQELWTEIRFVDEAIDAIHGRHSVPDGTVDEAIAAVEREQKSSQCIRGEVQSPQLGHNGMDDVSGTSTTLETERELADALLQSEADALREEQVHLHEAILRSKAELEAESMPRERKRKTMEIDLYKILCLDSEVTMNEFNDGLPKLHGPCLLLLEFGRVPKGLPEALLASSFAIQLQAQGVTLMPEWAEGRLVLAKDVEEATVSEARGQWHVAVRAVDEDKVYTALHSLGHNVRPRLKPGGRFLVPEEASLFNDASEEHARSSGSCDARAVGHDLVNRLPIPFMRTFVHFPEQSPASPRKTLSAP